MSTTVTNATGTAVAGTTGNSIIANSFLPTKWETALQFNYVDRTALPLITFEPDEIDTRVNQLIYNFVNKVNVTSGTLDTFDGTVGVQSGSTSPVTIKINNYNAWSVNVSVLDEVQGSADLLQANVYQAGLDSAEATDKVVYADIISSAGTSLPSTTITIENAYNTLVNMCTTLDWGNVPKWGRYFVIDPAYLSLLVQDPRFNSNPRILENGMIDGERINGCEIVVTTEMAHTSATGTGDSATLATGQCFLIQKQGYAFGQQFTETQYCPPSAGNFNNTVQGLMIYGFGVLRPGNIVAYPTISYDTSLPTDVEGVVME